MPTDVPKYVAVKMHLIGSDEGFGFPDNKDVNIFLANLNRQFQPTGIVFYFSGNDFNYIYNTQAYQGLQTSVRQFEDSHKVSNAINVFIAGNVVLNGEDVGGYSSVAPTAQYSNQMWIKTAAINYDARTAVHEFGHYFGLYHTFHNAHSATIALRELVTRNFNEIAPRISANCDVAGDYVTDTPTDNHNGSLTTLAGCSYTGTARDRNNDLFVPDVENFMSYYNCQPNVFTPGQYERMIDAHLIITNPANDFSVTAPETIQNPPSNLVVVGVDPDADYMGFANLSWIDNSNVETGYIIERAANPDGPSTAIAGTAANITFIDNVELQPGALNYFRIKPSNTKDNYSTLSAPIAVPALCGNAFTQSCDQLADPTDSAARIENFQLRRESTSAVLINNQSSGCSLNGIGNYYSTFSAVISPGETLSFTMDSKVGQAGWRSDMTTAIYADWNNDDVFDVSEMIYLSPIQSGTNTGSFTVPANLPLGDYRLRVCATGIAGTPGPCMVYAGEMEDYKLTNNTLGITTYHQDKITLYPNPVNAILHIAMPDKALATQLVVKDILGKTVLSTNAATDQINTESLNSGTYFLQVYTDQEFYVARFVKQ